MINILELTTTDQINSLTDFLGKTAPEQSQFVTGNYFKHGDNFAFGVYEKEELIAAIRYCKQLIGVEQQCPKIIHNQNQLYEAKINVFAVNNLFRCQGLGTALQKHVINHARNNGCYQLASYSTYDKLENYYVKLKLGFCVQPEMQSDGTIGCYFLMRL